MFKFLHLGFKLVNRVWLKTSISFVLELQFWVVSVHCCAVLYCLSSLNDFCKKLFSFFLVVIFTWQVLPDGWWWMDQLLGYYLSCLLVIHVCHPVFWGIRHQGSFDGRVSSACPSLFLMWVKRLVTWKVSKHALFNSLTFSWYTPTYFGQPSISLLFTPTTYFVTWYTH